MWNFAVVGSGVVAEAVDTESTNAAVVESLSWSQSLSVTDPLPSQSLVLLVQSAAAQSPAPKQTCAMHWPLS